MQNRRARERRTEYEYCGCEPPAGRSPGRCYRKRQTPHLVALYGM